MKKYKALLNIIKEKNLKLSGDVGMIHGCHKR